VWLLLEPAFPEDDILQCNYLSFLLTYFRMSGENIRPSNSHILYARHTYSRHINSALHRLSISTHSACIFYFSQPVNVYRHFYIRFIPGNATEADKEIMDLKHETCHK
jgi:hypothetical protein